MEVEDKVTGPMSSSIPEGNLSAHQSMQTIDGLHKFMHNVVNSTTFEDTESSAAMFKN